MADFQLDLPSITKLYWKMLHAFTASSPKLSTFEKYMWCNALTAAAGTPFLAFNERAQDQFHVQKGMPLASQEVPRLDRRLL